MFFDEYAAAELWGKDLYQHLTRIYEESRLCIVLLSADYRQKEWTSLEWRSLSAVSRARDSFAVLPIRVGSVPHDWTSIATIDWAHANPDEIASAVVERLETVDEHKRSAPPNTYHVIKRDSGWSLKRAGAARATSVHDTKEDAIAAAKRVAKRHAPAEVVVHNSDGSIATRESLAEGGE